MRDHSQHIQVNKEKAVEIILQHCKTYLDYEVIPVEEAIERIIYEDVVSLWNSPNCRASRLDSVAVRWADFEAGMPDTSAWIRGKQWEFANTGVAMPEGFDTAIVVEHVIFSDDNSKVSFTAMPSAQYAGTSEVGSKLKKGTLIVPKGTKITPILAAHITSGNVSEVKVIRKPKVAFLPTGNELVKAGPEVPYGKNVESNSMMIAAKIRQWGGEPILFDIVPDEKDALKNALCKAAELADIVVLNAGSSKGNDDWGIEMLEELGTVYYHQTNHGPGHHSSFGVLNGVPVVGISGPPGGAAFTTDYYLYPAMMAYFGMEPNLKKISVRLAVNFQGAKSGPKKPLTQLNGEDRPMEEGEFYSVRQMKLRVSADGTLEAYPAGGGHLGPMEAEQADAYYLMPSWSGKKVPEAGDVIEVELRPEY